MLEINRIHNMDCLDGLPALQEESVQCAVTSVPYLWLRSYGIPPSVWPRVRYAPLPYLPDFKIKVPAMTCCLGEEPNIEAFIGHLVHVFRLLRPALQKDGLLWLNIADRYETNNPAWGGKASYRRDRASDIYQKEKHSSGLTPKNIIATSWPAALALQADGWILRADNIWHKTNCMPDSVRDRSTKAHEYVFQLARSGKYYYDFDAVKEPVTGNTHSRGKEYRLAPKTTAAGSGVKNNESFMKSIYGSGNKARKIVVDGLLNDHKGRSVPWAGDTRNMRSVWTVPNDHDGSDDHTAKFPEALARRCILAGSRPGDVVLDPFAGTGTAVEEALKLGRKGIGFELNKKWSDDANHGIRGWTTLDIFAAAKVKARS